MKVLDESIEEEEFGGSSSRRAAPTRPTRRPSRRTKSPYMRAARRRHGSSPSRRSSGRPWARQGASKPEPVKVLQLGAAGAPLPRSVFRKRVWQLLFLFGRGMAPTCAMCGLVSQPRHKPVRLAAAFDGMSIGRMRAALRGASFCFANPRGTVVCHTGEGEDFEKFEKKSQWVAQRENFSKSW